MKRLFPLFAAFAVLMGAMPSEARATSEKATKQEMQAHKVLFEALERRNVPVYLNPSWCENNQQELGRYESRPSPHIRICQTNYRPGWGQVAWSVEDLDTLRHEAFHYLQDCISGVGDNWMSNTLQGKLHPHHINNLVRYKYGEQRAKDYLLSLQRYGYEPALAYIELEAEVAARTLQPVNIVAGINKYCKP